MMIVLHRSMMSREYTPVEVAAGRAGQGRRIDYSAASERLPRRAS
jgi:exonuclease III